MSQLVEQAQHVFRRSGMRLTPQRSTILEVLDESDTHLDAEGVYHQAKRRDPNISMATVYRTLATLKQLGLIHERHLTPDDQRHYYEMADQQHYHFTCLECGRVIEFDTPFVTQIKQEVADEIGVEVIHAQLQLEGYCAVCVDIAKRNATKQRNEHLKG